MTTAILIIAGCLIVLFFLLFSLGACKMAGEADKRRAKLYYEEYGVCSRCGNEECNCTNT